jgi:hypothetical protein
MTDTKARPDRTDATGAPDLPAWVTFPGARWETITPEDAGLDPNAYREFLGTLDPHGADFGGEDHTGSKWARR